MTIKDEKECQGKNTQETTQKGDKDMEDIINYIKELRKRKEDITKIAESKEFSEAFWNCFNVGGFAPPAIVTEGGYRVAFVTSAKDPGKWETKFFLTPQSSLPRKDQSGWQFRQATILEVISCWDRFYPLLAKGLSEDKQNLDSVEKAVVRLKELMAPEIMISAFTDRR